MVLPKAELDIARSQGEQFHRLSLSLFLYHHLKWPWFLWRAAVAAPVASGIADSSGYYLRHYNSRCLAWIDILTWPLPFNILIIIITIGVIFIIPDVLHRRKFQCDPRRQLFQHCQRQLQQGCLQLHLHPISSQSSFLSLGKPSKDVVPNSGPHPPTAEV